MVMQQYVANVCITVSQSGPRDLFAYVYTHRRNFGGGEGEGMPPPNILSA
jgi:hypothetical protein